MIYCHECVEAYNFAIVVKIKIMREDTSGNPSQTKPVDFNEYIQIPSGHDIYITIPSGVYRCNINDGIFPEDRRFFQKKNQQEKDTFIIRYNEIAHHPFPVLNIKPHYPSEHNDMEDLLVSFKPAGKS